jgi:hypothetical protein
MQYEYMEKLIEIWIIGIIIITFIFLLFNVICNNSFKISREDIVKLYKPMKNIYLK